MMQINPAWQLAMLLSSFLFGFAMGGVWELMAAARILFGVYLPPESMRALYERPLPLLRRAPTYPSKQARRVRRAAVIALGDCLFCLCFALGIILVLYYYNDGVIRPLALLLALGGLGIWRVSLSYVLPVITAYLAYFWAVLRLYAGALLALPVRLLIKLVQCCVLRPVRALLRVLRMRLLGRTSRKLCAAQLLLANKGLAGSKNQKKERENPNERKKDPDAVGDSHTHRAGVRGGIGAFRQSLDGME